MKIVDAKTFLAMPEGTIFQRVNKNSIDIDSPICIKDETTLSGTDFYYTMLVNNFEETDTIKSNIDAQLALQDGHEQTLIPDTSMRDGLHDMEQRYAVWSRKDVYNLIRALEEN